MCVCVCMCVCVSVSVRAHVLSAHRSSESNSLHTHTHTLTPTPTHPQPRAHTQHAYTSAHSLDTDTSPCAHTARLYIRTQFRHRHATLLACVSRSPWNISASCAASDWLLSRPCAFVRVCESKVGVNGFRAYHDLAKTC